MVMEHILNHCADVDLDLIVELLILSYSSYPVIRHSLLSYKREELIVVMLYITGYWLIRGGSEPLNRLLSSGITTSDVSDAMAEVTFKRHLQSILRLHMNGIIEVQLLLSNI